MLRIKFDWIRVPEKKALSTPALPKPDIGAAVQFQRPRSDDEVSALQH